MTDVKPDAVSLQGVLDPLEAPPPTFSPDEAERIAAERFGIRGTADPLNSERDQNVRITTAGGEGYVLKISNPAEDPGFVDMQTQAMLHIARTDPGLPVMRLIPASDGAHHVDVTAADGRSHIVRLVTLMPGRTLEPRELDLEAIRHFGAISARLGLAMRGFFHPAAGHPLLWNIKNALDLRPLVANVPEPARRAIVDGVLDRFEEHVQPAFDGLRGQVIHNDLTSDNALFDDDLRVSGILDFGDMAYSALVCDLVSTVEALMGERDDPYDTLRAAVAGFTSVTPLEDDEIALLPDLLLTRWATTAVISAWRVRRYPENADYITGWDTGVWAMLESFHEMGPTEFHRRVHQAVADATQVGSDLAGGGVRRGADRASAPRAGLRDLTALLRPPAPPGGGARRLDDRRGRPHLPGRVQQRARGRALPSARGPGDRAAGRHPQHEHAVPAPLRAGPGRAPDRDHARWAGHRDVRELRERGERPGVADGDGCDGRTAAGSSPRSPTTA